MKKLLATLFLFLGTQLLTIAQNPSLTFKEIIRTDIPILAKQNITYKIPCVFAEGTHVTLNFLMLIKSSDKPTRDWWLTFKVEKLDPVVDRPFDIYDKRVETKWDTISFNLEARTLVKNGTITFDFRNENSVVDAQSDLKVSILQGSQIVVRRE